MKTFDVFLKDNITNMDVFFKDNITNVDVFLKDRLTYMDAVVRTLFSREYFTFSDKLLIDCFMNELTIIKKLQAATSMEIIAEVDRLLNMFIMSAQYTMQLDICADSASGKIISGETDMHINTVPAKLLLKTYSDFENYKTITSELESYGVQLFLGNTDIRNYIGTSSVGTNKISYFMIDNNFELVGNADFSGKKVLQTNSLDMQISSEQFGIFYLALVSGNTLMHICTKEIPELDARSVLHGYGYDMILQTKLADSIKAEKYLTGNSDIQLLSSVVWMLNKYIYPQLSDIVLSCSADSALYRYRTLADMDNHALSEFDDMNIEDVDIISLE